ncbi:hypothetical protein HOY80DRAFT_895505 [Tuber brumale]|nr:hypothetical protein HOY80DRAFT_895505 [Tuber brumale]
MLTAAQKGHVYWLPDTPQSQSASFDSGKLNHPVLVLGAVREGKVQVLLITSFGNTTLSERFPNSNNNLRKKYLPLKVAGAAPHPDNGVLLSVVAAGHPPLLTKQSYVNLEPFEVEVRLLDSHRRSTCRLPDDTLALLMRKLHELHPGFSAHQEGGAVASNPSPPKTRPPPTPPPRQTTPATRHQPPPAARPPPRQTTPATRPQPPPAARAPSPPPLFRSPVPTKERPLLSPQGAYSSPYGTVAPRQDYGQDLEWNAPRQSRYTRATEDYHHDSEGDCPVWDALVYIGIAVVVLTAVRYCFL